MQTQPVPLSPKNRLRLQAQLLDAVNQAVIATDLDGCVVFWNRFAEVLYGWTSDEILGRDTTHLIPTPASLSQRQEIMECLKRGESWAGERFLQRRDGTTFTVYATSSPIFDGEGGILGIVGVSRDITEEKRLQETNRLLAEASVLLIGANDSEQPLSALAGLAVPELADWCAVHLLQPDGSIEQVTPEAAGLSPSQTPPAWLQKQLADGDSSGVASVLQSGEAKLVSDAAGDVGASGAAVGSYMIVPLVARPRTLGAITFVAGNSGRRFDGQSLALAQDLADHVSIYLDKSQQLRETERAKAQLERSVAERTAELQATAQQLEQSEAMVQTLLRITKKLNSTLDLDTLLEELSQEAIALVGGEGGFAGVRTAGGVTVHKHFRWGKATPFEHTWPPGNGVPGWVLEHKIPWGTNDAANDPVVLHDLEINVGVSSIICTPILDSAGEVLGFFDIRNKLDGSNFTIADQELLLSIAPAASIAIQNALAYQQRLATVTELEESSGQLKALAANLETAREQERTEIARELHDQLGQSLTAMKFDLAWLTDRLVLRDSSLPFAEKVKTLKGQMDLMIKSVRRIATELRPGMLDDLGLAASIEWQARDFEKRTGICCEVNVTAEDLPLQRTQSLAVFRILQEALTNVARHAEATKIEINLSATPEILTLQVRDNGRGIRASEIKGLRSLGLMGMRERAQHLGGTFDIKAAPGGGTTLTVCIPVKQGK